MQIEPAASTERDALWLGVLGALVLCLRAAPDVGYGDAGELSTAAVVLGVAHPTGFALDLLWLKAASLIPLGSLAFRLNIATALTGGLALGLCAAVIGALAARAGVRDLTSRRLGVVLGVTALLSFGPFGAATQAVEVYALGLSAVLLAMWLALEGGRAAGALAVLVGLAAGMHVTAGLYTAPIFLAMALAAAVPWRFVAARIVVLVSGALVLAYLPLASLRDPAADWGDPETLSGMIAHLTAQRIRSAFQGEMFGGSRSAPALLFEQLSAFGVLACFMVVALAFVLVRARGQARERSPATPFVIGVAIVGGLDVAYALLINPMGVRELQCGHVAGACLAILGGVAAAWLLSLKTGRVLMLTPEALAAVVALGHLMPVAMAEHEDGYALVELFGSGGPVSALPPRTVFLCAGDNACAAGMFAMAVERVRPDVDVAPAQHLWDATVLRNIEGFGGRAAPTAPERGRRAIENALRLMRGAARRPIALETHAIATDADPQGSLAPLGSSPFVSPVRDVAAQAFTPSLTALSASLQARFGRGPGRQAMPPDERARVAWSRVYGELGTAALNSPAFVAGIGALQRAVAVAPSRATAWINLGVAFEKTGQLEAAVQATQSAVELDPLRPTGWFNLAQMEHSRGNVAGARHALALAAQNGVRDPRLSALAEKLNH
jgi:tetratricopeptide (TPR) repeat protein